MNVGWIRSADMALRRPWCRRLLYEGCDPGMIYRDISDTKTLSVWNLHLYGFRHVNASCTAMFKESDDWSNSAKNFISFIWLPDRIPNWKSTMGVLFMRQWREPLSLRFLWSEYSSPHEWPSFIKGHFTIFPVVKYFRRLGNPHRYGYNNNFFSVRISPWWWLWWRWFNLAAERPIRSPHNITSLHTHYKLGWRPWRLTEYFCVCGCVHIHADTVISLEQQYWKPRLSSPGGNLWVCVYVQRDSGSWLTEPPRWL